VARRSILFRIAMIAAKYVSSSLSPAKVNRVFVDDDNRTMTVIVPDDQLSLAIGKNGQNVRLAVKLTGWNIDMKSETMAVAKEEGQEGENNLTKITGVGPAMAEKLFSKGIKSIAMVAATEPELLSSIPGIGEKTAQQWIETAGKILTEEVVNNKELIYSIRTNKFNMESFTHAEKRVHELAKELGWENKQLIARLEKIGIPVKTASSSLEESEVERIKNELLATETREVVEERINPR